MWYTIRWICSVYGSVPVVLVYVYVNVPSVFWLCSVVFGRFCPCSGCVGCLFIDTILNEMDSLTSIAIFFSPGRPRRSLGSRGEEEKANEHSGAGKTQSRGLLCCTSEIYTSFNEHIYFLLVGTQFKICFNSAATQWRENRSYCRKTGPEKECCQGE